MRKNKWFLAVIVSALIAGSIMGCENTSGQEDKTQVGQAEEKEDSQKQDKEQDKEQDKDKTEPAKKPEDKEEEPKGEDASAGNAEESPETTPAEKGTAVVYVPNDDATGWNVREETISQITPDALIGLLVGSGALTDSVTVNGFEEAEDNGQNVLKLDLSSNFQDSLRSMGSAGELLTIGSVVNTFLDTYKAEEMQITVEGNSLETGHEIYEGYFKHISY